MFAINDTGNLVMNIFITLACLFIFILAFVLLKPFRVHQKRIYSTISLKVSYLLYLLLFLSFFYIFFVIGGTGSLNLEESVNTKSNVLFGFLLFTFFVPNLAILLRRSVRQRTIYNTAFTITNIIFSSYLVYLIKQLV